MEAVRITGGERKVKREKFFSVPVPEDSCQWTRRYRGSFSSSTLAQFKTTGRENQKAF
jgi:hypothetical protein